jgi:hypothetical protein
MMAQFYGSALENAEFQWLISNEIQENLNGPNDTNQKSLPVVELEKDEEDKIISSINSFFFFIY